MQARDGSRCVACSLGMSRMGSGPHIWLLLEIAGATVAVLGLLCLSSRTGGRVMHAAVPWVLTVGALLPTLARGRDVHELGLCLGPVRRGMLWLAVCSLCMLIFGAIGIGVLDRLSIRPPLSGAVPRERWPMWILFQFGLVAVPEELFFRGYFLTNCLKLLRAVVKSGSSALEVAGVCLSAGVFAVAHVLILGSAASIFTFFPGLIFAWLFLRCGSLAPSVLLHGAANIGYMLVLGAVA